MTQYQKFVDGGYVEAARQRWPQRYQHSVKKIERYSDMPLGDGRERPLPNTVRGGVCSVKN